MIMIKYKMSMQGGDPGEFQKIQSFNAKFDSEFAGLEGMSLKITEPPAPQRAQTARANTENAKVKPVVQKSKTVIDEKKKPAQTKRGFGDEVPGIPISAAGQS